MDQKENREEILEKAYKLGQEYEARATDCCQSTIAAILDAIGIKDDALLQTGSPFAGGLGFSSKGTCGALVGASMVIGRLYGRTREEFDIDARREPDDPEFDFVKATKGWDLAYELYERFLIHYGSCICFDVSDKVVGRSEIELLIRPGSPASADIGTKIRRISSHAKEGCGSVVGNAARWAVEIILREGIPEDRQ
jgi:C_GCAxxG_C_C family probable redox protein